MPNLFQHLVAQAIQLRAQVVYCRYHGTAVPVFTAKYQRYLVARIKEGHNGVPSRTQAQLGSTKASFTTRNTTQHHCAAPAIFHVPAPGAPLQTPPRPQAQKRWGRPRDSPRNSWRRSRPPSMVPPRAPLKGTTSPGTTYCHYLEGLGQRADRVVRIPKMIVESAASCVLSSSKSYSCALEIHYSQIHQNNYCAYWFVDLLGFTCAAAPDFSRLCFCTALSWDDIATAATAF